LEVWIKEVLWYIIRKVYLYIVTRRVWYIIRKVYLYIVTRRVMISQLQLAN